MWQADKNSTKKNVQKSLCASLTFGILPDSFYYWCNGQQMQYFSRCQWVSLKSFGNVQMPQLAANRGDIQVQFERACELECGVDTWVLSCEFRFISTPFLSRRRSLHHVSGQSWTPVCILWAIPGSSENSPSRLEEYLWGPSVSYLQLTRFFIRGLRQSLKKIKLCFRANTGSASGKIHLWTAHWLGSLPPIHCGSTGVLMLMSIPELVSWLSS